MHGTVLRCHKCGAAKETKRRRDPVAICFCLPWEGERPFAARAPIPGEARALRPGELVQRE